MSTMHKDPLLDMLLRILVAAVAVLARGGFTGGKGRGASKNFIGGKGEGGGEETEKEEEKRIKKSGDGGRSEPP
jgi:hypothetical protein